MLSLKAKAFVLAAVAAVVMGIVGCGGDGKKSDTPAGGTSETGAAADTGAAAGTTAAAPADTGTK